MRGLVWLLLAAWLGGGPAATAAEADPVSRPRIGLVLSGGGARGAAHVGVLRVMEELRIPVHVVVGTSMGSIVGGLYAAGLSPDELEEGFVTIDWAEAFHDKPDRKRIAFRRKEDDFEALLPFELGVGKGGLSMRSGIINGQKINLILRRLSLHTVGIDRFDQLNIPYRAVAADLATGDAVILDRGDLALAMRASMSVPGVFTPVEVDGHVLIDGGIAMNLPVAVAQSLGADRIIAVDVGTPPNALVDSLSSLGVVSQTFAVLAEQNVKSSRELLTDEDLLIVPDLDAISSSDFDKLPEGMAVGEQAARRVESELRRFSVSEEEFAAFLATQRKPAEHEALIVDRVEVRGMNRTRPDFITRRLKSKPGQPLSHDDLHSDLERIQQLGEFESVDVRLIQVGEEKSLVFDARPKSWGPGYLRFGLGFESSFDGDSDFRAILNYRRAEINRNGGEWKTVVSIGDPFSVETELFQPLNLGGIQWFAAPNLTFIRDKEERFLPGGAFEVLESDEFLAGFDMGVQFRNWGEIRAGARRGSLNGEVVTGAAFPDIDVDIGGWQLQAILDQLDNVFFPRTGGLVSLTGFFSRESLGADTQYDKVELRTLQAWSIGRHTFLAGLNLGTDLGSDIPFYDEFELGGFMNLSGLTRGELQGDVMGLASVGYYRQIAELGALGRGFYAGAFAQAGNVWTDVENAELSDLVYSGTLFAGLDTALMPIYIGWGLAEGGQSEFYLFIGRAFQ